MLDHLHETVACQNKEKIITKVHWSELMVLDIFNSIKLHVYVQRIDVCKTYIYTLHAGYFPS